MTAEDDRRLDAYLWDPSAPAAPEVDAIERRLAPARFDEAKRPLKIPAFTPLRARGYARPLLALAAGLMLVAAGASAFLSWRSSWPAGAAWPITVDRVSPGAAPASQLQIDKPLQLGDTVSAQVDIARIGTMRVEPGSALTLSETTSTRHRVRLDHGAVSVRVWAPPGRFSVSTPAGTVMDLGCIFDLAVEPDGTSRVHVDTGWVQLENGWGETLVPAGASSVMTAASRPGVPLYDDAPGAFVIDVRAAESAVDEAARAAMIGGAVRAARTRDVLTLLMLANASSASLKRPLLERAAQLFPPPPSVSVDAIVAGDRQQLWRWYGTLNLPPAKSWLRNWRDALPRLR